MRPSVKSILCGLGLVALACGLIDALALLLVRSLTLSTFALLTLPGALLGAGLSALFLLARSVDVQNRPMLVLAGLLGLIVGLSCTSGPSISASVWRWPLLALSLALPVGLLWLLARASKGVAITVSVAGVGVLLATDLRVLPRLYPVFHVGLIVATCMLAAELLYRVHRHSLQTHGAKRSIAVFTVSFLITGVVSALYFAVPGMPFASKIFAFGRPHHFAGVQARARERIAKTSAWDWRNRDVVLLTIDAFRADMLEPRTMPRLAARARGGMNFAQASTPTPNSSYALVSLHTGTWVHAAAMMELPLPQRTLADGLRKMGYRSLAVYPPSIFSVDRRVLAKYEEINLGFDQRIGDETSIEDVCKQLRVSIEIDDRPLFFWAHLMDPHEPYEPKQARFGESPIERYRAELFELDAQLDECLNWLLAHPRRPIVFVSSDHGEAFGEHRSYYHGTTLYREQLHVPLLLLGADVPAAKPTTPVSLVDIAPTVLAAVKGSVQSSMFGYDLSRPDTLPQERFIAALNDRFVVRRGLEKAICDGPSARCEVFLLDRDGKEQNPHTLEEPWALQRIGETLGWLRGSVEAAQTQKPGSVQTFGCAEAERAFATAQDVHAALFLRNRALHALSRCPEQGESLAIALLADGYMRVEAAHFLAAHGSASALEPLRRQLEQERYLAGRQALRDAIDRLEQSR